KHDPGFGLSLTGADQLLHDPRHKRMNLGIEIGGTKLQLVLGDTEHGVRERRKLAVDVGAGAAGIRHQIERTLAEFSCHGELESVGVGFGGPVDWKTGRVSRSHHIEGWSEFDLRGWLETLA